MKVLWFAVICFVAGGVIIGGAFKNEAENEVKTKTQTVEVVREVPVETVKTVTTNVVPQSCMTAITLSQEVSKYISAISQGQGEQKQVMSFAAQAMTVDGFMDLGRLQIKQRELVVTLTDSYAQLDGREQALTVALEQCNKETK